MRAGNESEPTPSEGKDARNAEDTARIRGTRGRSLAGVRRMRSLTHPTRPPHGPPRPHVCSPRCVSLDDRCLSSSIRSSKNQELQSDRLGLEPSPKRRMPLFWTSSATIRQPAGRLVGCLVEMATRNRSDRMRAVVYDRYGPPEVLRLEEVERPIPKDDEVLIKVHATTVNRTDTGLRSAEYFISRFLTGLLRPKRKIPGTELAGEIEAVGAAVTEFGVGDHVFGVSASTAGAHAEFVCLPESAPLAHKPSGMTFEEAAAVPDGVILAMAYLRRVDLRKRRMVLIYGASGSIGTAGVQLAEHFDADVTAVCNTKNVELVRSLGADRVIDHTQEDFTKNGETYDFI